MKNCIIREFLAKIICCMFDQSFLCLFDGKYDRSPAHFVSFAAVSLITLAKSRTFYHFLMYIRNIPRKPFWNFSRVFFPVSPLNLLQAKYFSSPPIIRLT